MSSSVTGVVSGMLIFQRIFPLSSKPTSALHSKDKSLDSSTVVGAGLMVGPLCGGAMGESHHSSVHHIDNY